MSDQELKVLLDTIETPPADLTGPVLDKLRSRKKKRFSTPRLLAAALIAAGALLGARQFYQYVMIGADGSIEEAQVCASQEAPIGEEPEEISEPAFSSDPDSPTDFYLQVCPDGGLSCGDPSTVEPVSVSRLWELVADAPLKLPFLGTCPEEFTDGCGDMHFYLSPEMADLPAAWIDGGNGYYFQRFRLPETLWKNISRYLFVLEDGSRRIDFDVELTEEKEKILATGAAKSENIKIGKIKAVYVEEPPDEFFPLGRTRVFFTGKIPKTPYIYGFDLGGKEREARGIESSREIRERAYRYYACTLTCEGLDRETVLEIAQSIVFPEQGQPPPAFPAKYEKTYEDGGTLKFHF